MSREIKSLEPIIMTSKSFDGKHELTFNEGSHRYKLNNKPCPGWTTVIKSSYPTNVGLMNWMKTEAMKSLFSAITVPDEEGYYPREAFWPISEENFLELLKTHRDTHEDKAQEAADVCTLCHSYAELHSLGKKDEAEALLDKVRNVEKWPLIEKCINKYLAWEKTNKGELVLAEGLVASPEFGVCGKFDRLDSVNGKLRLRDYKTSKGIYLDHFIQEGGYDISIKEWFGLEVTEYEVLRFGKEDGEFESLLITDPEKLFKFRSQAIRCKATFDFKKMENDDEFNWKKKQQKLLA